MTLAARATRSDATTAGDGGRPVLEFDGVGRRFDAGRWVLRDVSLTIRAAERVVLVGESGAGKSTLLNLAAGLDRPDAGRIRLMGESLDERDEAALAALRRRHVGFVFQAFHLVPHLTLWQNVALPLLLVGRDEPNARREAIASLDALGLAGRGDALPAELSGGEQQRVALARALIHRPPLILADEPTGNLDPSTAALALRILAAQCEAQGASLLMVTHSAQAASIADRVLRLGPAGLEDVTAARDADDDVRERDIAA
ncbi:MAG: ABC transporter ATP-binding protein [Lautropia sp.]